MHVVSLQYYFKIATKKLTNAPTKTRNSPTKPLVPGKPKVPKTNIIKINEYLVKYLPYHNYLLVLMCSIIKYTYA